MPCFLEYARGIDGLLADDSKSQTISQRRHAMVTVKYPANSRDYHHID